MNLGIQFSTIGSIRQLATSNRLRLNSESAFAMKFFDSATASGGAFPIDFQTAFKGHACEYISQVDPTYFGYDAILDLHIEAYEALPAEYVDPWAR